jgi:proteic killer suppression protein
MKHVYEEPAFSFQSRGPVPSRGRGRSDRASARLTNEAPYARPICSRSLSSGICLALAIACRPCYYAIVIQSFADQGTEDVFNGRHSASARQACPAALWNVAFRKLDQLDSAVRLADLRAPPGNRLEALVGDRRGQHSIRINEWFRICFHWTGAGPESVQIVNYH